VEVAAELASKGTIRSKIVYDGSSDPDKGGEEEGRGGEKEDGPRWHKRRCQQGEG
jgi:hypothetical protein